MQADMITATSVLRVCTAGSVDDGKSTLIGRLLLDAKVLMDDQVQHVEEASRRRGFRRTELALLTDGLRAEREQGITIDVAWRYFSGPGRRFILADTPGHVQYTRNMVTGASTADVALVLVDARVGLTEQSRRHLALVGLLGVPHLCVVINKMDQVGFAYDTFVAIRCEVDRFLAGLESRPSATVYVPVSALHGDNVVTRSTRTPFYDGPTLLEHLGALDPAGDVRGEPLRLSVQWVIRPQSDAHHDYRGLAGRVLSGAIVAGDTVEAVHSGARTRVARIERSGRDVTAAARGASVVVHLDDDLDVGRGALLVDPGSPVRQDRAIEADLAWFSRRPGLPGSRWLLAHGATTTRAHLREIAFTTDVRDGSRVAAAAVEENGIARVKIEAASPLAWEPYATRRSLGAAILIDEATNETAGALMLR